MGLSTWQLKRQLAYLAAQAAWADSPYGLVYSGGAFVSEDLDGNFQMGASQMDGPEPRGGSDNDAGLAPFCRVRCVGQEWDRNSPASRVERATFELWSTAGGGAVPGSPSADGFDSHGINNASGWNRAEEDALGKSQGRDVDELVSRFASAYGQMVDSEHAILGRCRQTQAMRKVNGSMVLKRVLEVEAFNTLEDNYYHPVLRAAGSGNVTLAWTPPPRRFDELAFMVRRGATSGASAPAQPDAGSGYFVGGAAPGATGLIDASAPGTGIWNYAIFAIYAESRRGWPTFEILSTTQMGCVAEVHGPAGNFTFDTSLLVGATVEALATALAAAINASGASADATAVARDQFVVLEPISAWLLVTKNGAGLERTNGDNWARATCQVVVP